MLLVDRDGTLNTNPNPGSYLYDPDAVELDARCLPLLTSACHAGWTVVVVSNQGGLAKGLYTPASVYAVHQRLASLLAQEGITVSGLIVCPHHPMIAACSCRKPAGFMSALVLDRYRTTAARAAFLGNTDLDRLEAQAVGLDYVDIGDPQAQASLIRRMTDGSY